MNSISFACPFCSGVFQVDQQQASSQVYCPHCEKVIDLPMQFSDNESSQSTPTPDVATSPSNSTSNKKRTSKKPRGSQVSGNKDLFPPGYVPESTTSEPTDSKPASATVPANPPQPVASTSSTATSETTPSEPPARPSKPPGAQLPRPTGTPKVPSGSAQEALLPPGVTPGSTGTPITPASNLPPTDHLLPPGVSAGHPKGDLFSGIDADSNATMDGSADEPHTPQIALLDPVKTVEKRGQEIELKQRTPEEKIQWKLRKNMMLWISGILILLITLYVMKN